MPEERPALVHAWVKTGLARGEGTLIRRCDSAGCTGCGSPAFTKRCFFREKVLPEVVSTWQQADAVAGWAELKGCV